MAKKIKDLVEEAISSAIEELGYELVEVEYVKKVNGMNLTVFIDCEDGIKIEDCEKVHKVVDVILDEINPTEDEPYFLSISSLGLDRPIKTDRDFNKNIGKEIEIKLYAPVNKKKIFVGVLIAFNDNIVEINENGTLIEVEREKIANIIPVLKF